MPGLWGNTMLVGSLILLHTPCWFWGMPSQLRRMTTHIFTLSYGDGGVLVKACTKSFPYREGCIFVGIRLIFSSISLRSRNIVLIIIKEKRLSKNTGSVSWWFSGAPIKAKWCQLSVHKLPTKDLPDCRWLQRMVNDGGAIKGLLLFS